MWDQLLEVQKTLDAGYHYLIVNAANIGSDNWQFIAGMLAAAMIIYGLAGAERIKEFWRIKKIQSNRIERERWMSTPEQENLEKVLISDGITDVLDDLEYRGRISHERAVIWYRRFGNLLNLPDLIMKHEVVLKDRLRKKHKLNGKAPIKPLPFPDDTKPRGRVRDVLESLKSQLS